MSYEQANNLATLRSAAITGSASCGLDDCTGLDYVVIGGQLPLTKGSESHNGPL